MLCLIMRMASLLLYGQKSNTLPHEHCGCAEDPQLAEFLRLMQPRHKNALWADEPIPQQQQQQQPSPANGSKQKATKQKPDKKLQQKQSLVEQEGAQLEPAAEQQDSEDGPESGNTQTTLHCRIRLA